MKQQAGYYLFSIDLLKRTIVLFLLVCAGITLKAQTPEATAKGKISGKIIDSISGQPVEYATISLSTQAENKVVNGATTDAKGMFTLTGITPGTYKLLFYFIGYKTGTKNNIVIDEKNAAVELGTIKLANSQVALQEVTVTSEKSIIENKIDKMVYNADQDVTSQGGVASDILKKIPQVSVDADGNVELQGNANIRFLINGKPSAIFGNNIADVLQSIPASQIQSVEVITSPGAKYDAEGTGGIINIILKKSTAEGINGNVSVSAGTRLENASANLNVHHGHLSANAFFGGSEQLNSRTINKMNRVSQDTAGTAQLLQDGTTDFVRTSFQTGAGLDWEISSKNDLSASLNYNSYENNSTGVVNRESLLQDNSGNRLYYLPDLLNTENKYYNHSLDYGLNYKRTFKKEGQELDVSYNATLGKNYAHYSQIQTTPDQDTILNSSYGSNPGTEKETDIAIDYTHPLNDNLILETGAKAVITNITSTSDVYLYNKQSYVYDYNATQSSALHYKSNVYAYYLSASFKLFKWLDVKAGCRYEYTDITASFSNAGKVNIAPYGTVVPSIVFSRTFKNNQTLKLSYGHRIERPDYHDLNPFVNATDPKNITTGNAALRPEIGDKLELSYNKVFEKGATINVTGFYRGNKDDIQSYTRYYSSYRIGDSTYSNVAVSTRENVGHENNFGLNIFASVPATSKINLRTNISAFERYIINGALAGSNIHGFNYRINLNVSYQVTDGLSVEGYGNFNSPRINTQGTMPAFFSYNFALREQLFHKKASIAITATNPFNKYIDQKTELTGENFTLSSLRELPYRSFGINFTYKFGKLEFKREKEEEDVNAVPQ